MSDPRVTAHGLLTFALLDAQGRGQAIPCHGPRGEWWTSEDADEREAAVHGCQSCPVLTACAAAADDTREAHHVWGGTDRTRPLRNRPTKKEKTR
ncbi:WhiB family transcriptional regulator [Kytococcus schroeteri]|uniref:WhiB family transcriptional regulator n=1 Tax=Kytococcus schroeteri TaxID=138300 RepID=UPI0011440EFC|nr:WhiB family transcriptional regulator [Kytococcus schroeteri]